MSMRPERPSRHKTPHKKSSAKGQNGLTAVSGRTHSSSSNDHAANVAALDTDLHGAITAWNKAAERLFGYSEREAVGQSLRLVIPATRETEQDELSMRAEHGETID